MASASRLLPLRCALVLVHLVAVVWPRRGGDAPVPDDAVRDDLDDVDRGLHGGLGAVIEGGGA
jgi:hypothetical protein